LVRAERGRTSTVQVARRTEARHCLRRQRRASARSQGRGRGRHHQIQYARFLASHRQEKGVHASEVIGSSQKPFILAGQKSGCEFDAKRASTMGFQDEQDTLALTAAVPAGRYRRSAGDVGECRRQSPHAWRSNRQRRRSPARPELPDESRALAAKSRTAKIGRGASIV